MCEGSLTVLMLNIVQMLRFSSRHWCVALPKDGEYFLCPQRVGDMSYSEEDFPLLAENVNAVALDKYYVA